MDNFKLNLITKYFKSRLDRGFSLVTLGPNEARILYDFLAACGTLILVLSFNFLFIQNPWDWWLLSFPFILLVFNGFFGIYSFARTATGKKKAILIFCSLSLACLIGLLISRDPSLVLLWGMILFGPLIIPRILLGLQFGRHKQFIKNVVNQKGTVLVVGGAGYIGSHVVDLLLAEGKFVRVLDRLMYGRESVTDFIGHPNFELIEGDATDIAKLTEAMQGASTVVHLAGLVGDPACSIDQEFTRHTNIISTRMIKDVAQAMGVYRFVFASSCSVYGATEQEVNEGDTLNPVSLYAHTKIDSERELLYSVRDDFHVTILRFATVFGHSRRPRFDLVANLFTAQGMSDGLIRVIGPNQWRPFIHVRDLARATTMLLNADPAIMQGQVFNVGDKRLNLTIGQLGEQVREIVARNRDIKLTVEENVQDKRNYAVSFEKIRSTLGFQATIMINEGVEEMVEHFKKGTYRHYRDAIYSNLEMTKESVSYFQDPMQASRLYSPLAEQVRGAK